MRYTPKPAGRKSRAAVRRDKHVASPSLSREYDFVYARGRGVYIWDVDGRKRLDFASGIAVNNVGHANPEVVKAIKEQLRYGIHCGFLDMYAELPVDLSDFLLTFMEAPLNRGRVFLSNSGTEAIEAAYKLCKWNLRRLYSFSFKNAFHGRTMGALSLTNTTKAVQRDGFEPFLPVRHSPFSYPYRAPCGDENDCANGCLQLFEKELRDRNVSGVFMEPIQGEGGYIVPDPEFVKGVAEICHRYDSLFVSDEVQSGAFRTGTFAAIERFGVTPDVACFAKGIGGGMPLGATLAREELMKWPPGSHANTFGGNLVSCAAGIAALRFMKKERLGDNARRMGDYFLRRLREMQERHSLIGDVRGLGLMIGIELVRDSKKSYAVEERKWILKNAEEKGLVLLPAGESTIRIAPPLVINRKEADRGLDILESCFKDFERR